MCRPRRQLAAMPYVRSILLRPHRCKPPSVGRKRWTICCESLRWQTGTMMQHTRRPTRHHLSMLPHHELPIRRAPASPFPLAHTPATLPPHQPNHPCLHSSAPPLLCGRHDSQRGQHHPQQPHLRVPYWRVNLHGQRWAETAALALAITATGTGATQRVGSWRPPRLDAEWQLDLLLWTSADSRGHHPHGHLSLRLRRNLTRCSLLHWLPAPWSAPWNLTGRLLRSRS
jgi:hypothetical protein